MSNSCAQANFFYRTSATAFSRGVSPFIASELAVFSFIPIPSIYPSAIYLTKPIHYDSNGTSAFH